MFQPWFIEFLLLNGIVCFIVFKFRLMNLIGSAFMVIVHLVFNFLNDFLGEGGGNLFRFLMTFLLEYPAVIWWLFDCVPLLSLFETLSGISIINSNAVVAVHLSPLAASSLPSSPSRFRPLIEYFECNWHGNYWNISQIASPCDQIVEIVVSVVSIFAFSRLTNWVMDPCCHHHHQIYSHINQNNSINLALVDFSASEQWSMVIFYWNLDAVESMSHYHDWRRGQRIWFSLVWVVDV